MILINGIFEMVFPLVMVGLSIIQMLVVNSFKNKFYFVNASKILFTSFLCYIVTFLVFSLLEWQEQLPYALMTLLKDYPEEIIGTQIGAFTLGTILQVVGLFQLKAAIEKS